MKRIVKSSTDSDVQTIVDLAKKDRTMNINKLHATFNQNGIPFLKKSNLQNNSDRIENMAKYLKGMAVDDACMVEARITLIESQIEDYMKMMRRALMKHPEISLVWLSLPGIRAITAASLLARLLLRFWIPD